MTNNLRSISLFGGMGLLLIMIGFLQSWSVALNITGLCLISAIMALGLNIQWGYAGLINAGVMGFVALGGLTPIIISMPPVTKAWQAGGLGIGAGLLILILTAISTYFAYVKLKHSKPFHLYAIGAILIIGFFTFRHFIDPAIARIEAIDSASTGYLGGLGLPILLSWIIAGLLAAGAAWLIGKIALGLRTDYLAIATLGIAEIIVSVLKNEDWLARGVKNVTGIPRPVPYEVDIKASIWHQDLAAQLGVNMTEYASILVKLSYIGLFLIVLLAILYLSEKALKSPWGRMMRTIRDNEVAASAMGKNVTARRLQTFILGSAVIGISGAMLTTLDGQFTPGTYSPLRYTFLIWVMVIVGGSGNNYGSILGGFVIWFAWIEAEPFGNWLLTTVTSGMADTSALKAHLLNSSSHMRHIFMGLILLLALRFNPAGLIPERNR